MIPKIIQEFFNDIDSPWTMNFKQQEIPTFDHEGQLVDWMASPPLPLQPQQVS